MNTYVKIYTLNDGEEDIIENVCVNEDCIDDIIMILEDNNTEEEYDDFEDYMELENVGSSGYFNERESEL